MDLYQMKYENIADRLKRLATSPPSITPSLPPQPPTTSFRQQLNSSTKRESIGSEGENRGKYQEVLKYTKLTLETDHSMDQQPDITSKRNFLKEKFTSPPREKRTIYDRSAEFTSNFAAERQEERMTAMARQEEAQEANTQRKGLAKVKSDGTLKIQEIMESFNSYKLNKEKFMSTLNKSHSRTETEPTAKYARESTRIEQTQQTPQDTRRLFSQIDNIWNEEEKQEKAPQFQRSKKVKYGLQGLTDMLNETIESQENILQHRPKDFSRGKLILRNNNNKTEESMITDKAPIRSILSPRGLRAPGKICKNSTRQFTNLQRQAN